MKHIKGVWKVDRTGSVHRAELRDSVFEVSEVRPELLLLRVGYVLRKWWHPSQLQLDSEAARQAGKRQKREDAL